MRSVLQILSKKKISILVHIAGIMAIIAIAMLIGLWIHDTVIFKN